MTREIESTFEYQEDTYKVVESTVIDSCAECDLTRCCDVDIRITGKCSSMSRTDGKDVHFELVNKE